MTRTRPYYKVEEYDDGDHRQPKRPLKGNTEGLGRKYSGILNAQLQANSQKWEHVLIARTLFTIHILTILERNRQRTTHILNTITLLIYIQYCLFVF